MIQDLKNLIMVIIIIDLQSKPTELISSLLLDNESKSKHLNGAF